MDLQGLKFENNLLINSKEQEKEKIAILVTVVKMAYWFLRPHLRELSKIYEVTLLLKNDDPKLLEEIQSELEFKVRVIEIPIERKIKLFADIVAAVKLFLVFRKESFISVHTITPKAGLLGNIASYLARVPIRIHTFQGEVWFNTSGFVRIFFKLMDRIVVALATNILVVSNSERDFLIKEKILKSNQAEVLGSGTIGGIDLSRFKENPEQKQITRLTERYKDKDIIFTYIGRLNSEKGLNILIKAFQSLINEHENARLIVAGPDEDGTGEKLRQFSLQFEPGVVKIFPFVKYPETLLILSDVLVLPSFREGFGVVILEAAAMGIPSIGSNIYGISDAILDGKTGLLFDVNDSNDLYIKMKTLLKDDKKRTNLGKQAYERVHTSFSQDIIVKYFIDYYKLLPFKKY